MPEVLAVEDVRGIVRLLGQLAEMQAELAGKRRYLICGLAKLINADVWAWSLSRIGESALPAIFWMIDGGWRSDQQRAIVMETNFSSDAHEMAAKLFLPNPNHRTQTRDQVMPSEAWYASAFFAKFRQRADLDDFMYVFYPLGDGVQSALSFHRSVGKPTFSNRERCIAHVVTTEIDWLHRVGADVPASKAVTPLSPRLRQMLLMLLAGDSRKQIAHRLHLSEHTVAGYMKALHKHFNVNSRGELLSKFIACGMPQ